MQVREIEMQSKQLSDTAVVFTPKQRCDVWPVSPELYAQIDQHYSGFGQHVLVSMHSFTQDWSTWEIHPHGDELVCLVQGAAEFVLKTEQGEDCVALSKPGSYVVVPANTWHTAKVDESATCLFFTPGEGTENSDSPPE